MRGIVLAGGSNDKMSVLTGGTSKTFLSLMGRKLFYYPLRNTLSLVDEIAIVVNNDNEANKAWNYIPENLRKKVRIIVQREEGIEEAILSCKDYITEEWFLLSFGDIIMPREAFSIIYSTFREWKRPIALVTPSSYIETYGVVRIVGSSIIEIYEKPEERLEISHVLGGVFILPKEIFSLIEQHGDFIGALNEMAQDMGLWASLWTGDWIDVGYPWDLISAFYVLANRLHDKIISKDAIVSPTAIIEGPVIVEEGAIIDHYAVIKGPVYIGRNVFVGKGSFIREYSSIEEGAVVGAHSEIKRSVLQPYSTVGSFSLVNDSVLGSKSVVEPRVTVLSDLREKGEYKRPLPLQGIVARKRKLGVILENNGRIKANSVVGPAIMIFKDGKIEEIV